MAYTTIDDPTIYFNTKLYTGNGGTQSITGVGFQPDWVWLKHRNGTNNHCAYDAIRGVQKTLHPDLNYAESTDANNLTAFGTDGFTVGSATNVNGASGTYVAWNWKAGTSFSNDASATGVGTIDSTGSINTTAGFSIISYTGTGSAGSIAHGLGVKPDWILSKDRTSSGDWNVYHDSFAAQERIKLNSTGAKNTNTSIYASLPTSSVVNVGTGGNINTSGNSHILYCFAEKKGYSKFGSLTGNGSTDGTFVYTGFKPAWLMIKRTDASGHYWHVYDNKREPFNPVGKVLYPNRSDAEYAGSNRPDLLSNGFKNRSGNTDINASGGTYIFMAFAESPFVNSNGVPNNAR